MRRGDLWSKNVVLILALNDTKRGEGGPFYKGSLVLRLLKRTVLDQPTVDNGGVSRERSVAAAVGCWHFNSSSIALQPHFNCTSTTLQIKLNGRQKKYFFGTGTYIRFGRENQRLWYAGFL